MKDTTLKDLYKRYPLTIPLLEDLTRLTVYMKVEVENPINKDQEADYIRYDEGLEAAFLILNEKLQYYIEKHLTLLSESNGGMKEDVLSDLSNFCIYLEVEVETPIDESQSYGDQKYDQGFDTAFSVIHEKIVGYVSKHA
jgi:hypothetical protein